MEYKTFYVDTKTVDAEAGIYEAMISTEDVDRDGDIMVAGGAELESYLKNPVVLFGHNYREARAVVGKALEIVTIAGKGIKAVWQFASKEISEDADQVRRLWAGGFLNATSIGFIPKLWEPRTTPEGEKLQQGRKFTQWELLEFSIVPVPANQNALRLAMKSMDDLEKAVIPYADHGKADEAAGWSAPTLAKFTASSWEELSGGEKRRIAAHYTWSANMPPENFGDLKLPHHKPGKAGIGPAVWRGVAAAMAALLGARGGVAIPDGDKRGVYNHLAKHYKQFEKEPPEFREYSEQEVKDLFEVDEPQQADSEPTNDDEPHDESELEPGLLEAVSNFIEAVRETVTRSNHE